jgi:sugar/nucleoside kinase (ribokinase family)
MRSNVTFAGNVIVDCVKMLPEWPERGMLVAISGVSRSVGGSVPNTGIDLRRLDPSLAVSAIAKVGADEPGDFALGTLSAAGIDTDRVVRVEGAATSTVDCLTLERTGERTFLCLRGANDLLAPGDIDVSGLDCDIFHLGYLLLLDGMDAPDGEYGTKAARLLAKVQSAGIKTSIDIVSEQSDRFERIVRPALKYCDYCVINEIEASRATGVDKDDMRGLCEGLVSLGVRECAVVHRPEGSAAFDRRAGFASVGSLELPEGWIKGAVGAGDAFCAGMLYSFLTGMPPEDGMRLASCAAAWNLSVADATGAARSFQDTMELERKFRRKKTCW